MDDSSGESAVAAPSQRYPDWVMLDPHNLVLEYPKGTTDYSEDYFRWTSAHAMTSKGELIRVSCRAVRPPEVSRFSVSCTRTKNSRDRYYCSYKMESMVIAAQGNFILLSLGRNYFTPELFVYTVGSIGPPTLRLLPSPYTSTLRDIGLVCDGDTNEFVAADLKINPGERYLDASHADHAPAKAVLYVFRSGSPGCKWKAAVPEPRIRHKKGQGSELNSWSTDVVVPCADSLCYVDYSRGVLFLDILSGCPELRYVRLPTVKIADPYGHGTFTSRGRRECPEERSLCAADGGRTIKFVEVVTSTFFISRTRATACTLFTIKVWRLRRDDKDMTWEKESELEDADLWTQQGYGDLPRVAPTFPRVSMEDPNVFYFVLRNRPQADEDEAWVIAVDMLNKTLRSSFRYTKASETESLARSGAFIPCEFSKDLLMPGTG